MNVLLVSQCSKKALVETRRILDQFAERRGERTWHTPITEQGLKTLHKMLRRTARKNTAVACHWVRGRNHSELLWVVGDAGRFNARGATPTNTTRRNILRRQSENDWRTGEEIALLCQLAAVFHDFGKANQAFQNKLRKCTPKADAYRHEWISLRIWQAFSEKSDDEVWLNLLTDELTKNRDRKNINPLRDGVDNIRVHSPFASLPPLAKAVAWLIVSHHRMPAQSRRDPLQLAALKHLPDCVEDCWCGMRSDAGDEDIASCWRFAKGLPLMSSSWRRKAGEIAEAIMHRPGMSCVDFFDNPFVLHIARMVLMLADHHYSSQPSRKRYGDGDFPLWANTIRSTGERNQRLDEHLIGVSVTAKRIARTLPRMDRKLPRIARHKGFQRRSKDPRFRWQDRAFDLARSIRERSAVQGFFGVNMASTGRGKTLANGRVLYALADPALGARFNIGLGLRTLTLQTGDVYRELLGLGSEDLAVLVGGGPIRRLHELHREEEIELPTGSASAEALFEKYQYVHFEGSLEDGPLNRWLRESPDAHRLLNAPVLVCTIDHLMPATEGVRGGRQIAPMLRLLSSDLALDEPDDFAPEDLPALARLVNWAAMLGSRLLLSSATLPPSVVQGLFQAYLEGRRVFQLNRGVPEQPLNVCCAWFDEFSAAGGDHASLDSFARAHETFVAKRVSRLAKEEVYRRARIVPVQIAPGRGHNAVCAELASDLRKHAISLHERHHSVDPVTGKRLSLGLIRMANIDPLVETSIALCRAGAPDDELYFHLCVYHSQHPLLVRSGMEQVLDRMLNRKDPLSVFQQPEIRRALDDTEEPDHLFVVMATSVAEVGRDHDYDWAVVEPSSMRSIIQLAGRVRRHRFDPCTIPNLILLDVNVNHLKGRGKGAVYSRPGFEDDQFPLETHHLAELLRPEQLDKVDATSRICENMEPKPHSNLADLEHERLRSLMIGVEEGGRIKAVPVHRWWTTRAHLSGELQRKQPFRLDPLGRQRYALLLDEDGLPHFNRIEEDGTSTPVHNLLHAKHIEPGPRTVFWGEPDYTDALERLADTLGMEAEECARRFGVIELPVRGTDQGWYYHPALGFSRFR